jgi:hypothetical protein
LLLLVISKGIEAETDEEGEVVGEDFSPNKFEND